MPEEGQPNTAQSADQDIEQNVSINFLGQDTQVPAAFKDTAEALAKAANDQMTKANESYDSRLKMLEEEMTARQQKELAAKKKEMEENKDIEGITKQLAQEHEAEINKYKEQVNQLDSKLRKLAIKDSLAQVDGIMTKYLDDAVTLYLNEFDISINDGKPQIKKKDGTPILNSDGTIVSDVSAHAGQWIQNKPHFLKAKQTPGTGAADDIPGENTPAISKEKYDEIMKDGGDKARELAMKIMKNKIKISKD